MKKFVVAILAVCLVMGSSLALAQGSSSDTSKKEAAPPLKWVKGTIKFDGDKASLVDSKGKSWAIVNPEAVKGHDGHKVEVQAHIYKDKGQIHVMEVKMAAEKEKKSM